MSIRSLLLVGAILVATIALAILGERATTRSASTDRVTVIYWEKWTGQEGEAMRTIVDDFNKSQDKILVKYLTISGIDQKTMLSAAGGNPPDVAGIWQDQTFQFAEAGALTDLSPMANEAGLTRDYYISSYYDALAKEGKLWALPSTPASIALHVRPDLVPKEYSTPETFPKTLEEFDAMCEKINVRRPDGSLELAGFLPSNPGWWNWSWPLLFGGQIADENGPTVDTPEAETAFNWVLKYSKMYGVKSIQNFQSGFGNFASPQDPFMSGKVATELNGVWKGNYIKVYRSDIPWFAVPFPYPKDRPDLANHTFLSQDVLVIPKGAKNVKEAFEFIRYVQRQDVMEKLCTSHGKNSPLQKVSEEFFANHPNQAIRLFDELARSPKAIYPPRTGFFPQLNSEHGNIFSEVNTQAKTPKQALSAAQNRLSTLYAKYKSQVLAK